MRASKVFRWSVFIILGAALLFWLVRGTLNLDWKEKVSFNERSHLVVVESKYPLGSWFSSDAIEFGVDNILYYEKGFMGDQVTEIHYQDVDSIYLVEGAVWWRVDIGMPGSLFSSHYRIYFAKDETAEVVRKTIRGHFYADFRYEERKSFLKKAMDRFL